MICPGRPGVVVVEINLHGQSGLFEIARADRVFGRLLCLAQSGQKHARQHGDDRDHDQKLDERKKFDSVYPHDRSPFRFFRLQEDQLTILYFRNSHRAIVKKKQSMTETNIYEKHETGRLRLLKKSYPVLQ